MFDKICHKSYKLNQTETKVKLIKKKNILNKNQQKWKKCETLKKKAAIMEERRVSHFIPLYYIFVKFKQNRITTDVECAKKA